jgi:hypothetical protein
VAEDSYLLISVTADGYAEAEGGRLAPGTHDDITITLLGE